MPLEGQFGGEEGASSPGSPLYSFITDHVFLIAREGDPDLAGVMRASSLRSRGVVMGESLPGDADDDDDDVARPFPDHLPFSSSCSSTSFISEFSYRSARRFSDQERFDGHQDGPRDRVKAEVGVVKGSSGGGRGGGVVDGGAFVVGTPHLFLSHAPRIAVAPRRFERDTLGAMRKLSPDAETRTRGTPQLVMAVSALVSILGYLASALLLPLRVEFDVDRRCVRKVGGLVDLANEALIALGVVAAMGFTFTGIATVRRAFGPRAWRSVVWAAMVSFWRLQRQFTIATIAAGFAAVSSRSWLTLVYIPLTFFVAPVLDFVSLFVRSKTVVRILASGIFIGFLRTWFQAQLLTADCEHIDDPPDPLPRVILFTLVSSFELAYSITVVDFAASKVANPLGPASREPPNPVSHADPQASASNPGVVFVTYYSRFEMRTVEDGSLEQRMILARDRAPRRSWSFVVRPHSVVDAIRYAAAVLVFAAYALRVAVDGYMVIDAVRVDRRCFEVSLEIENFSWYVLVVGMVGLVTIAGVSLFHWTRTVAKPWRSLLSYSLFLSLRRPSFSLSAVAISILPLFSTTYWFSPAPIASLFTAALLDVGAQSMVSRSLRSVTRLAIISLVASVGVTYFRIALTENNLCDDLGMRLPLTEHIVRLVAIAADCVWHVELLGLFYAKFSSLRRPFLRFSLMPGVDFKNVLFSK